jgi:hypothetical protein
MPVKIYWLHDFENASRPGIMARPRGNEWTFSNAIRMAAMAEIKTLRGRYRCDSNIAEALG